MTNVLSRKRWFENDLDPFTPEVLRNLTFPDPLTPQQTMTATAVKAMRAVREWQLDPTNAQAILKLNASTRNHTESLRQQIQLALQENEEFAGIDIGVLEDEINLPRGMDFSMLMQMFQSMENKDAHISRLLKMKDLTDIFETKSADDLSQDNMKGAADALYDLDAINNETEGRFRQKLNNSAAIQFNEKLPGMTSATYYKLAARALQRAEKRAESEVDSEGRIDKEKFEKMIQEEVDKLIQQAKKQLEQ